MDSPASEPIHSPPAYGVIEKVDDVTGVVLRAMAGAPSERLRKVMNALVRHLHAFALEVGLSQEEYDLAVDILNRIGKTTDDAHNEAILIADVVGFSTLVTLLNSGGDSTETAAALLGPFWRDNSPPTQDNGSIVRSPTPGPALFATCLIADSGGRPLGGVEVDVWHASPVGLYDNQDENQADMNLRGRFTTGLDGRFRFRTVKPAGYPIPIHGPTGDLLRAQCRHNRRPAHLHFLCVKPGYKTLITQVFVDDDEYLQSDVVFGVTRALVGDYRRHDADATPPQPDVKAPWYTLEYNFVMSPGDATRPIPPIK